ncbi:MAG: gliding motility-associated C-terminal domain-containing protein [Bacteroidota bacterium]
MRAIQIIYLLIILSMIAFDELSAQCINEPDREEITFQEDFGRGGNPGPVFADNTDYNFGNPAPGNYTSSNTSGINGSNWHNADDHTPGDTDGYMLIFDARGSGSAFFTFTRTDLCPNSQYKARIFVANIARPNSCGGSPDVPRIGISVENDLTGASATTPLISLPTTQSMNWVPIDLTFSTDGAAVNSYTFRLFNEGGPGCGKDFAIDDFQLLQVSVIEDLGVHDLCTGPYTSPTGLVRNSVGTFVDELADGCTTRLLCYEIIDNSIGSTVERFDGCPGDTLLIQNELIVADTTWQDTINRIGDCVETNTIVVNFGPTEAVEQFVEVCTGDSVWVGDSIFYTSAGRYIDTLLTPFGCDSIVITHVEEVNVSISLTVDGQALDFEPGIRPAEVQIQQGDEPRINVSATGLNNPIFQWQASDQLDCPDQADPCLLATRSERLRLDILQENLFCDLFLEIDLTVLPCEPAYIPNAFSPNFDGVNDRFRPFPQPCVAELLDFSVYDRWGGLRYSGTDPLGWDGSSLGREAATGVYMYTTRMRLLDGTIVERAGSVMLLR